MYRQLSYTYTVYARLLQYVVGMLFTGYDIPSNLHIYSSLVHDKKVGMHPIQHRVWRKHVMNLITVVILKITQWGVACNIVTHNNNYQLCRLGHEQMS